MAHNWVTLTDGTIVHRYQIIGTADIVYTAWRPGGIMAGHSTRWINGTWYHQVGTANLPDAIRALPYGSDARMWAADGWYENAAGQETAAILQAYPHAAIGAMQCDGTIIVDGYQVPAILADVQAAHTADFAAHGLQVYQIAP